MIIVDSGFFYACLDASDAHHARAVGFLPSVAEGWITTWPVVTETTYLLQARLGQDAATAFVAEVGEGSIHAWDIPQAAGQRMAQLMAQYRKLPMDLADASLLLLAEHLNHGRILTTDKRDFGAYRWKARKPFVDLMAGAGA